MRLRVSWLYSELNEQLFGESPDWRQRWAAWKQGMGRQSAEIINVYNFSFGSQPLFRRVLNLCKVKNLLGLFTF